MDSSSSSSSHNWLAFSLSNHPHLHLSLFEAFSSPDPASVVDSSTTTATPEDHHHHHPHHVAAGATDLAMFTGASGAPKLENFLGCGGAPPMAQFPAETTTVAMSSNNNNTAEIYESELKTIAASFLRGYNNNNININNSNHSGNNNEQIEAQPPPAMAVAVAAPVEPTAKKTVDTFGQRTSIYRGVTRHRWTGRYEAHLWDNSCRREGQSRKGRQVYLGGYDKEDKAARAYDLAALKYWGPTTTTNFPVSNYEKELEEMKNMTRQEFVASLRRKSSGFSRGASIYRGVTRHHQHGRWQARIGRVAGNKDLYLGTFSTQEEAAEAYDIAAIKFRGLNAVTNFDMSRYDVKSIANSNLPIGGMSNTNRSKNSSDSADSKSIGGDDRDASLSSASSSTLSFALPSIKQDPSDNYWSSIFAFPNPSTANTKNPSGTTGATLFHSNPNASVGPFNMDFSTTTTSTSNGRFHPYSHYQELQQQQSVPGTTTTTTAAAAAFAIPVNNNVGSTYNVTTSLSAGYDANNGNNNISWNDIGTSNLHTFHHHHHQAHGKPGTLFQTPIFGVE